MVSGDNGTRDYFLMYRFDLANLPPSINKATLYLVGYASGGATPFPLDVHRITQSWEESATWSGPAPSQSWTPGGPIAPTIYASTTVTPAKFGGYEWDVTALVNEWLAGISQNFGLQLRFQPLASAATMVFGAREVSSPARRPQLRITP